MSNSHRVPEFADGFLPIRLALGQARPILRRDLYASGAALQMVIAGYTIGQAVLLITGAGWVIGSYSDEPAAFAALSARPAAR